jgi:hypothetical protein
MILNLFSVPIWIGNIDAAKINIQETVIEKQFGSGVPSTHGGENKIDNHSLQYLYQIICKLIEKSLLTDFEIKLENIWTNYYKDGDFQESHAHAGSELCFIIYKKIQE